MFENVSPGIPVTIDAEKKPLQRVVLHENVSPGIPVTIDLNIAPASRVNQGISLHLCYRFKIVVCVTHVGVLLTERINRYLKSLLYR
jgi:hypothetical protein